MTDYISPVFLKMCIQLKAKTNIILNHLLYYVILGINRRALFIIAYRINEIKNKCSLTIQTYRQDWRL